MTTRHPFEASDPVTYKEALSIRIAELVDGGIVTQEQLDTYLDKNYHEREMSKLLVMNLQSIVQWIGTLG